MTEISFDGRTVIVTGAGGGIGRTHALDIARRGGRVVVNDLGADVAGRSSPSRAMADAVVQEIRDAGGQAVANYDDVGNPDGAQRLADLAVSEFSGIDALINNAGNMRNAPLKDATNEDLEAVIATHLRGALYVTRAVWPHMQARGYGRIVFTSSATGMYGNRTQVGYAAAKAGIFGVMNVCALEGEEDGILCNAIMPTALGRMSEQMLKEMEPKEIEAAHAMTPLIGNSMQPAFNTALGVYLASESCTSTHGIYSACIGRLARVFVGVTPGWQGSRQHPATAEDVSAHFGKIADLKRGFAMPTSPQDEIKLILAQAEFPR